MGGEISSSALAAPAASAGPGSGVLAAGGAGVAGAAGADEDLRLVERTPWRWLRWWPFLGLFGLGEVLVDVLHVDEGPGQVVFLADGQ